MARPNPPDLTALGFGDELDEAFRVANPNPTRQGCPSHEVLVALSRRERPIEDPAYEHLLDCSPCYVEVRDMQRAHLMAMHERHVRRWWSGAAAAAVLFFAVGTWWFASGRGATTSETGTAIVTQATLDLRPYSVARSPTASDAPPPLELPRGVVALTLLLAVGSEPGPYDVQLLDPERRPIAAARGEAAIVDFVATLKIELDLRRLGPSRAALVLRRQGDGWHTFPVEVR